MRIGEYMLDQPISPAAIRVCKTIEKAVALRTFNPMFQVTLLLVAKRLAVTDEKLKIAGVWLIDMGVVDFIDDSVADREPEPAAGVISGAQAFLGAGSPA